jgi:hypothetical protein
MSVLLCGGIFYLKPALREELWTKLRGDPVFYFGLLFFVVVAVQCSNSNYWVVLNDVGESEYVRTPAKWLPWSVIPSEAAEMLVWFVPAWMVVLFVRNLLGRRHLKPLLYIIAWNSALLAFVGILQYLLESSRMLGLWKIPGNAYFATFDYPNHAAEWFYLNAFLAGGLAHDAVVKGRPQTQQVVWCSTFLLCLIAVLLTLSRFGAFVSMVLLGVALIIFLRKALGRLKGNQALNIYIIACIAIMAGMALFTGAGGGALANEVQETSITRDLGGRTRQLPPAWAIIRDYPAFGSGGWGYRWLAPLYVNEEERAFLDGMGAANVHCDPVQFLTEFGLVGGGCLAAVVAILFFSCLKNRKNLGILSIWMAGGIVLIFIHSFADLPFRSPAILYEWCILLSALPKITGRHVGST